MNIGRYIGIPFVDRSDRFGGADCFGLVRLWYREEYGIEVPDPCVKAGDSRKIFDMYLHEISRRWVLSEHPEVGCAVAMARDIQIPGIVQHFGIYIGDGEILHTLERIGSHKTTVQKEAWAIKGYYRWAA